MRKTMLTIAALAALGLATVPAMAEDHAAPVGKTEAAAHAKADSGQHKAVGKKHEKKHHEKKHHAKKHKHVKKEKKHEKKAEGKKDSDASGK